MFVYGAKPSGGDFDQARPSPKRRRLSAEVEDKEKDNEQPSKEKPLFPALFDGAESEDCARLRQKLYEKTWASVDARIQVIRVHPQPGQSES